MNPMKFNMWAASGNGFGYGSFPKKNGYFGAPMPLCPEPLVGFSTNSKDPVLMRSRVFVGNIDTKMWSREQIITMFSAYGTILGVSVFKGYAFIQYDNPESADLSIKMLNGKTFNGSALDVKFAVKDLDDSAASSDGSTTTGGKRKGADGMDETYAKKGRGDSEAAAQIERNKVFAATDQTTDVELYRPNVQDTMTCGKCRFMTHSFEEFRDHIKADCYARDVPVKSYGCAMCAAVFIEASDLLHHARDEHNVVILREEKADGDQ